MIGIFSWGPCGFPGGMPAVLGWTPGAGGWYWPPGEPVMEKGSGEDGLGFGFCGNPLSPGQGHEQAESSRGLQEKAPVSLHGFSPIFVLGKRIFSGLRLKVQGGSAHHQHRQVAGHQAGTVIIPNSGLSLDQHSVAPTGCPRRLARLPGGTGGLARERPAVPGPSRNRCSLLETPGDGPKLAACAPSVGPFVTTRAEPPAVSLP